MEVIENTYTVKRIEKIAVQNLNKLPWENAEVLKDFFYPWQKDTPPPMEFRALWNEERFYFQFIVKDQNILVKNLSEDKMEVIYSDRVEIFFKRDDQMKPYYCLEMDPESKTLDYFGNFHRDFDFSWSWPGSKNLIVNGEIQQDGYQVSGSISIASLKNLGLFENGKMQAGLFRGRCLAIKEPESEMEWISWVDPQTKEPDFHVPTSFGILKLENHLI
ncbi:MAG: hypothetical protein KTR26_09075 [Flammeovirgaceae bacterium]|nr:hypothetical protein [Flammeovirgaceae bacterium]